jgi:hypothetical protein
MTTNDLKHWFDEHKSKLEAEFQKDLDRLALENEPEEILSAYDCNDQYEEERLV